MALLPNGRLSPYTAKSRYTLQPTKEPACQTASRFFCAYLAPGISSPPRRVSSLPRQNAPDKPCTTANNREGRGCYAPAHTAEWAKRKTEAGPSATLKKQAAAYHPYRAPLPPNFVPSISLPCSKPHGHSARGDDNSRCHTNSKIRHAKACCRHPKVQSWRGGGIRLPLHRATPPRFPCYHASLRLYSLPQASMLSIMGLRLSPNGLSLYSTRGGTSA